MKTIYILKGDKAMKPFTLIITLCTLAFATVASAENMYITVGPDMFTAIPLNSTILIFAMKPYNQKCPEGEIPGVKCIEIPDFRSTLPILKESGSSISIKEVYNSSITENTNYFGSLLKSALTVTPVAGKLATPFLQGLNAAGVGTPISQTATIDTNIPSYRIQFPSGAIIPAECSDNVSADVCRSQMVAALASRLQKPDVHSVK
jgi:hypothetical protein